MDLFTFFWQISPSQNLNYFFHIKSFHVIIRVYKTQIVPSKTYFILFSGQKGLMVDETWIHSMIK